MGQLVMLCISDVVKAGLGPGAGLMADGRKYDTILVAFVVDVRGRDPIGSEEWNMLAGRPSHMNGLFNSISSAYQKYWYKYSSHPTRLWSPQ